MARWQAHTSVARRQRQYALRADDGIYHPSFLFFLDCFQSAFGQAKRVQRLILQQMVMGSRPDVAGAASDRDLRSASAAGVLDCTFERRRLALLRRCRQFGALAPRADEGF